MNLHPADPARSVLLVVDMQPDFLPGGALAIAEGNHLIEPIAQLMDSGNFGLQVATQDWHRRGHVSFASTHPGHEPFDVIQLYGREQVLWPDHCVQGTPGAELCAGLPWEHVSAVIRKGTDAVTDSYSGFRNNWNARGERPPTGLAGYLKDRGIRDVYVCGLARDYCCKWSAEDAVDAGFGVHVLWDLTRAVDRASDETVRRTLLARGVEILFR